MSSRFKIEFGDPRHRRTGYLSNASRYSFVLDDKEWPSVEHYVCAQPFKGTSLEEQLRCSPSPWNLHFLIRGKRSSYKENGRVVKKYSKSSSQKNRLWYQKSITNKFFQNQRIMERLLNTGNTILVDVTCPYTGPILEKIRHQCREERFQKNFMFSKQELETSPDVKDILNSSLTLEDYAIINSLINLAWKNAKKAEKTCVYVEFIENTLTELYPKRSEFIIMLYQMRSPQMINKMPHYSNIINQIFDIFRKRDPYQEYDLSGSYLIGEILRWYKIYASPSEATQFLHIVSPNFLKENKDFSSYDITSTLSLETPPDITSTLSLETPPDITSTDITSTLSLETPPDITSTDITSTLALETPPDITSTDITSTLALETPPDITSTLSLETPPDITSTLALETPPDITSTDITSTLETPPDITSTLEPPSKKSNTLKPPPKKPSILEPPSKKPSILEPPPDITSTLKPPPKKPSILEPPSKKPSTLEPSPKKPSILEPPPKKPSILEPPPESNPTPDSGFLYPLKTT